MNPKVKELQEYHVAYVRKLGPYGPEVCGQAFNELFEWASSQDLIGKAAIFGVYWDDPCSTPPQECRTDACIEVSGDIEPDENIQTQTIEGGKYLVFEYETDVSGFQKAWEDSYKWVFANNAELRPLPAYEHYHNDGTQHPEGLWRYDICIAVK